MFENKRMGLFLGMSNIILLNKIYLKKQEAFKYLKGVMNKISLPSIKFSLSLYMCVCTCQLNDFVREE